MSTKIVPEDSRSATGNQDACRYVEIQKKEDLPRIWSKGYPLKTQPSKMYLMESVRGVFLTELTFLTGHYPHTVSPHLVTCWKQKGCLQDHFRLN